MTRLRCIVFLWTTICLCGRLMAAPERWRSKRHLAAIADWEDSPLSAGEEGVVDDGLKRSPEAGDAQALNAVFRWGKRRSPPAAYDRSEVDPSSVGVDSKRIFRWGKRAGGSSASVFRWGKRSRESGNPPVFRWGKRDYADELSSDLGTLSLFQWPGKRIDDGRYAEQHYTPVFRWGKRQNEHRPERRQTAGLFRWGKRSVDAFEPRREDLNGDLEQYGDS